MNGITGTANLQIDRASVTFTRQEYVKIGRIVFVYGSVEFATTTTSQGIVYINQNSYPFTPVWPSLHGIWVVDSSISGTIGLVNNSNGWFLANADGGQTTAVTLSGKTVKFAFSYIASE